MYINRFPKWSCHTIVSLSFRWGRRYRETWCDLANEHIMHLVLRCQILHTCPSNYWSHFIPNQSWKLLWIHKTNYAHDPNINCNHEIVQCTRDSSSKPTTEIRPSTNSTKFRKCILMIRTLFPLLNQLLENGHETKSQFQKCRQFFGLQSSEKNLSRIFSSSTRSMVLTKCSTSIYCNNMNT